jgi:hypothetical protein
MEHLANVCSPREPWNKGKLVGQKAPFKLKEIWAIRVRLQLADRQRELALFNLAIDSKLRACDLVKLRVRVKAVDQVAAVVGGITLSGMSRIMRALGQFNQGIRAVINLDKAHVVPRLYKKFGVFSLACFVIGAVGACIWLWLGVV